MFKIVMLFNNCLLWGKLRCNPLLDSIQTES